MQQRRIFFNQSEEKNNDRAIYFRHEIVLKDNPPENYISGCDGWVDHECSFSPNRGRKFC